MTTIQNTSTTKINCPFRFDVASGQATDLRFANSAGRWMPPVIRLMWRNPQRPAQPSPDRQPIRQQPEQPRRRPRQLIRTSPLQPGQDINDLSVPPQGGAGSVR
jgi:hypothetical protein